MSRGLQHKIRKQYDEKSLPGVVVTTVLHSEIQSKGTPRCICLKGGYTLEAAVVFPALACFFVSILFFFRVMQVELQIEKALADTAQTLAADSTGKGEDTKEAIGLGVLKISMMGNLKDSREVARYVAGGAAGIQLSGTEWKGDFIDIHAAFLLKLPVRLLGTHHLNIVRHIVCRKWTGWNGETYGDEEDIWVYVAQTGNVYHRMRECSHLKLTVRSINQMEIAGQRNENGERYQACEKCAGKKKENVIVYITNQGNRYHYDLSCGGIKRSIFMVRLLDVGDKRPCSRCGGSGG